MVKQKEKPKPLIIMDEEFEVEKEEIIYDSEEIIDKKKKSP